MYRNSTKFLKELCQLELKWSKQKAQNEPQCKEVKTHNWRVHVEIFSNMGRERVAQFSAAFQPAWQRHQTC